MRTLFALLLVTSSLSGCLLVPFVDAFKQTGVTEGDRQALLQPEVKKFSEALGWGNKTDALQVVSDESRVAIAKQLKGLGEEERLVETKIDEVEWGPQSYDATVVVKVRYYKVPYYIVKTREERQKWTFNLTNGWKLSAFTVDEEVKG